MNYNTATEKWKDVIGYEGIYEVSSLGRIKSIEREVANTNKGTTRKVGGCFLKTKPKNESNEYIKVNLSGKSHRVHRIVAEAFLPNPENKEQINHINGIKYDNRVENLEWCTAKHNMNHNLVLGVTPLGDNHVNSKLSEEKVKRIKHLLKQGVMQTKIAERFNVNDRTINAINKNLMWKHVKT